MQKSILLITLTLCISLAFANHPKKSRLRGAAELSTNSNFIQAKNSQDLEANVVPQIEPAPEDVQMPMVRRTFAMNPQTIDNAEFNNLNLDPSQYQILNPEDIDLNQAQILPADWADKIKYDDLGNQYITETISQPQSSDPSSDIVRPRIVYYMMPQHVSQPETVLPSSGEVLTDEIKPEFSTAIVSEPYQEEAPRLELGDGAPTGDHDTPPEIKNLYDSPTYRNTGIAPQPYYRTLKSLDVPQEAKEEIFEPTEHVDEVKNENLDYAQLDQESIPKIRYAIDPLPDPKFVPREYYNRIPFAPVDAKEDYPEHAEAMAVDHVEYVYRDIVPNKEDYHPPENAYIKYKGNTDHITEAAQEPDQMFHIAIVPEPTESSPTFASEAINDQVYYTFSSDALTPEPISEPQAEPILHPIDPIPEPVYEHLVDPIPEYIAEPDHVPVYAYQTFADPVSEPIAEFYTDPLTDYVSDPITEPIAEPIAEPTIQIFSSDPEPQPYPVIEDFSTPTRDIVYFDPISPPSDVIEKEPNDSYIPIRDYAAPIDFHADEISHPISHEIIQDQPDSAPIITYTDPSSEPHDIVQDSGFSSPAISFSAPQAMPMIMSGGAFSMPDGDLAVPQDLHFAVDNYYAGDSNIVNDPTPSYNGPVYSAPNDIYSNDAAVSYFYDAPTPVYDAPTPIYDAPTPVYDAPTPVYDAPIAYAQDTYGPQIQYATADEPMYYTQDVQEPQIQYADPIIADDSHMIPVQVNQPAPILYADNLDNEPVVVNTQHPVIKPAVLPVSTMVLNSPSGSQNNIPGVIQNVVQSVVQNAVQNVAQGTLKPGQTQTGSNLIKKVITKSVPQVKKIVKQVPKVITKPVTQTVKKVINHPPKVITKKVVKSVPKVVSQPVQKLVLNGNAGMAGSSKNLIRAMPSDNFQYADNVMMLQVGNGDHSVSDEYESEDYDETM